MGASSAPYLAAASSAPYRNSGTGQSCSRNPSTGTALPFLYLFY